MNTFGLSQTMTDVEEQLVDRMTGEIISVDPDRDQQDLDQIKTMDLPQVCRIMRVIRRKVERFELYRKMEVSKINESVDVEVNKLNQQLGFMESLGQDKLTATGERSIKYPGIGRVRFKKQRERLMDDGWQDLPLPAKLKWAETFPVEFAVETKVKSKAKEIKTVLATPAENENMANVKAEFATMFRVEQDPDRFEYVVED